MNTSAGSPWPYTRYCTWMPSGAIAMRGVPSAAAGLSALAGGAVGAGASFLPQANTRSAAASAVRVVRMRGTLGERRGVVTDRERGGEAGTFDAEQIDESRQAMIRHALDAKVRLRLAGTMQFRADSGVVRHQRAIGEARPVATDCIVEQRRACDVHRVVDALDPFDVGAEAHALAEIERRVDAEPRGVRHRIDEMLERRTRGNGEVVAAPEMHPRDALRGITSDALEQIDGAESRAVDDEARFDLGRGVAARLDDEPVLRARQAFNPAVAHQR